MDNNFSRKIYFALLNKLESFHLTPKNMKYSRFVGALFTTCALVSSLSVMMSQSAEARQCGSGWLDRLGCTIDPSNPIDNGSLNQKYYSVSVKNNSRETIWVAAHYLVDPSDTSGSCVQSVGPDSCNSPTWVTDGYWKLEPGQTSRILNGGNNISNRIIYFHAHNSKGTTWGASDIKKEVRGKVVTFFKTDMGGTITNFTQSFD